MLNKKNQDIQKTDRKAHNLPILRAKLEIRLNTKVVELLEVSDLPRYCPNRQCLGDWVSNGSQCNGSATTKLLRYTIA
jgi:hypothetical protein